MATNTRTVTVYDMATGAVLRTTTTAGEAERALSLSLAGTNHAQRLAHANGATLTASQLRSLRRKAERHALRVAEREMLEMLALAERDDRARDAHNAERANGRYTVARDYDGAVID